MRLKAFLPNPLPCQSRLHLANLPAMACAADDAPVRASLLVKVAVCGQHERVEMRVRQQLVQGICLWWSLPCIYRILRGDEHTPYGRFRDKRWAAWSAFVREADLGDGSLLAARTSEKKGDNLQGGREQCEFAFACASNRAFLMLASRSCSANRQTGSSTWPPASSRC